MNKKTKKMRTKNGGSFIKLSKKIDKFNIIDQLKLKSSKGNLDKVESIKPKTGRYKRVRNMGDYGSAIWGLFGVIALIYSLADVYRTEKGIKIDTSW